MTNQREKRRSFVRSSYVIHVSHRPFPIIWRFQSSVSHLTTKQGSRDFKGKTRNPRFSIRCYSLPPVSDGLRVSRVRGSGSRGNEGIIRRQVKIFQAKGKGSETWRRESVRSYDRKFDSNLPPSLSLSPSTDGSAFFPDPDPINCHRADGNKYSYSSA